MVFKKESDFEEALIKILSEKGWEKEILKNPTEKELKRNWAYILFENNRGIDRLNNCPLTDSEMEQIIEQINTLRTPLRLNSFINGKTITITRDNEQDTLHFKKQISLKIYDRREIAAGQSRYQIVQQPKLSAKSKMHNDRRGDIMLLINGMPVIHIELKRSGVPISQAYEQIKKYTYEGVFTGIFSLIQIFVAMNPDETIYFANPGRDGKFNEDYYFHWADFDNEPINDWQKIASSLLSIPMAHQLIGFYTVADNSDGVLKVMRSYQYYAANAISDKVAKTKWDEGNQRGGYIWHTTGSGKTMTSFKSAQLISSSNDADKVVFLTDRIELGTQSLKEYRSFADERETVQATENTNVLITKLKSTNPADTLIVTSIQKMSNIKDESDGLKTKDIEIINKKRLVFIVDEAHRDTFGDMMTTIKDTFPNAIFFGFTGTPIFDENGIKMNTQASVFGNELHRYSIADGIRDGNVLGFDPCMVTTYRDKDIRKVIALEKAKAQTEEDVFKDEKKKKIFLKFMYEVPMADTLGADGKTIKGIESYIPPTQYLTEEHKNAVVSDICDNWSTLSQDYEFHGIFATSSIPEAIEYYRLIKSKKPELKITCLFDPNIDNVSGFEYKEDGLVEILDDYNKRYNKSFGIPTHANFKKDVALRLAHKEIYKNIDKKPEEQLDLLIVVHQMLTGFDSKWINTLYLDKIIEYANLIQAFSRTNRLFGEDKRFGTIRYYRYPHTMHNNILKAVKLYSGDKPFGLFVDKLNINIKKINDTYHEIETLFINAGIDNFETLPSDYSEVGQFAKLFKKLNKYIDSAKVQGFKWDKKSYSFYDKEKNKYKMLCDLSENTFRIFAQRYKEIPRGDSSSSDENPPYDIDSHLLEINTEKIDTDFMNSRFEKYLKLINQGDVPEEILNDVLDELHSTFATLTQEEQKQAVIFLHDVQNGDVTISEGKTFRDYITEYLHNAKNDVIHKFATALGLDEDLLREMLQLGLTASDINKFSKYDMLEESVDFNKAKAYFEKLEKKEIPIFIVNEKIDKYLRQFIITGKTDLEF